MLLFSGFETLVVERTGIGMVQHVLVRASGTMSWMPWRCGWIWLVLTRYYCKHNKELFFDRCIDI